MIHTALRKMCDSKATTAAYNFIHLIGRVISLPEEFDPWRFFGDAAAMHINSGMDPEKAITILLNTETRLCLEDRFRDHLTKHRQKVTKSDGNVAAEPSYATTTLNTLSSIFELFTKEDIKAMSHYLYEVEDDE